MSFREKLAWVELLATIVVYGVYFWLAVPLLITGQFGAVIGLFIAATVAAVIVIAVPTIILAIWEREAANAVEDERERMIQLRATAVGAAVLMSLVWCTAAAGIVFSFNAVILANLAFAAMCLAEIARWGTQITLMRLGA